VLAGGSAPDLPRARDGARGHAAADSWLEVEAGYGQLEVDAARGSSAPGS
jgi:hypothetical protein